MRQRSPARPARPLKRPALPLAALAFAISAASQAETTARVDFNIQPQALESALIAFTEQAHVQLVVNSDDVRSLRAPGVVGQLSADEALKRLLIASGLTYQMTESGTVIVRPQPAPPVSNSDGDQDGDENR